MEKKPFVVSGECSESDTEEEINYPFVRGSGPNTPTMNISSPHKGKIVIGEAPESDEELDVTKTSDVPASTTSEKLQKFDDRLLFKTLLHKKLRESNFSLLKNITHSFLNWSREEHHKFHGVCQQLVDDQVLLQEAISDLNALHHDTVNITAKLSSITSASFLPNIIIPADEVHNKRGIFSK